MLFMVGDNQSKDITSINIIENSTTDCANFYQLVNKSSIKRALSKFNEFVKANDCIEIKRFMNEYIDKLVVGKTEVEVTLKVASAIFNADFPDDDSGAILIILEITRKDLKKYPKQRRKVPLNCMFGENYLKEYKIISR